MNATASRCKMPLEGTQLRPRKRVRLMSELERSVARATPNTTRSRKRTNPQACSPAGRQKRRRPPVVSSACDVKSPPPKRYRGMESNPDMMDWDSQQVLSQGQTKRKKNKFLRDVLRAERIERSVLKNIRMQHYESMSAAQRAFRANVHSEQSEAAVHTPQPQPGSESGGYSNYSSNLSADDDVCEVIDASECSESVPGTRHSQNKQGDPNVTTPSVQAGLLEDGRCVVHVVKRNGTMQTIVFDTEAEWQQY